MYMVSEDELIDLIESMSGRETMTLAEDFESGFKCTVSKHQYGIVFTVTENDEKVLREIANHSDECIEKYNFILSSFFGQGFSEEDDARVDEIVYATYDYLRTLLDCDPEDAGIDEECLESISFEIEEVLYSKYGFAVDHPVMLTDGTVISNRFVRCEYD